MPQDLQIVQDLWSDYHAPVGDPEVVEAFMRPGVDGDYIR